MINSVLEGDCLNRLRDIPDKFVDMIYLDPPFYSQKLHKGKSVDNKDYLFEDKWESVFAYREYMTTRLYECKRVLKDSGSIFVHCDRSASHHLRLALDEVFGPENFQSEIIWSYKRWSNSKKGLLNSHQTIYFYSINKNFKFNTVYTDYSATTNLDQILQKRKRNGDGKAEYMRNEDNQIVLDNNKKGVPLNDVWEIPYLNPKAKERVGYPTQKPVLLLERIISLVTDEYDIVLDPFCGSGTTLVAAKMLNRNYIGIDQSNEAVELSRSRLSNPIKTESNLLNVGIKQYNTKTKEELEILSLLNAKVVQRNKGLDGLISRSDGKNVQLIGVKIQKESETIETSTDLLIAALKKRTCKKGIVIVRYDELLNNQNLNEYYTEGDIQVLLMRTYQSTVDKFII